MPSHTVWLLHERPSVTGGYAQPLTGSHVSFVHGLPSSQAGGGPGVHEPAMHVSRPSHTSALSHMCPSSSAVLVQPAIASHVSTVHGLSSSHAESVPIVQTPATHTSQMSLGLQRVPSLATSRRQPSIASQVSFVHASPSSQANAMPAVHSPATHVSRPLHTVPSSHVVPSSTGSYRQVPVCASHMDCVHGLSRHCLGSCRH